MIRNKILAAVAMTAMAAMIQTTQATLVNTGLGASGTADAYWDVAPPGADALITSDTGAFPFNGSWINNDATSKWISYSYPLNTGPSGDVTYTYTFNFTATAGDVGAGMRWLSDNSSTATITDNTVAGFLAIGSRSPDDASTYSTWNAYQSLGTITVGDNYTITVKVLNASNNGNNPTGLRVEFSAVPEPSTMIAGALLLLPFGASTLRILRKARTA